MTSTPRHALTVDVEDWYQVSAFEAHVDREQWDKYESRVVESTHRVLELFARHDTKGTFFTLGWVAKRHPALIAAIHEAGHEVASHGYEHRLVHSMDRNTFRDDLIRARAALEAAAPVQIGGFRAPSFSITRETPWAYEVLAELGYRYSSSIFPVRHDRYGIPGFPRGPVALENAAGARVLEFPMTTWRVLGRNLPASGGGWLRLLPLGLIRRGLRQAEAANRPGMLYFHPWEVDPDQPRLAEASCMARFRHTVNLDKTAARLERLLREFSFGPVEEVLKPYSQGTASVACSVLRWDAWATPAHAGTGGT